MLWQNLCACNSFSNELPFAASMLVIISTFISRNILSGDEARHTRSLFFIPPQAKIKHLLTITFFNICWIESLSCIE